MIKNLPSKERLISPKGWKLYRKIDFVLLAFWM